MHKKGSLLIAMGLLLLAAALLLTGYNFWDAARADRAAQSALQELKTMIPSATEAPTQEMTVPTEPQPEETEAARQTEAPQQTEATQETKAPLTFPLFGTHREMPTVTLNGYRYIGMLDIPGLGLSLPVMEEWDYDRLNISPCRFTGNLYDGDLVLCAHNYPQHFGNLKDLQVGDEVTFTDAEGAEYVYAVHAIDSVGGDDLDGMLGGEWDLTLFTCTTSGQTRYVVRCAYMGEG